jgi:hypothetical protein
MTVTLHVDALRWRDQLARAVGDRRVALRWPDGGDVIGVIKGNGYGFGQRALAREAARGGLTSIAVGTVHEVAEVLPDFAGDIVVLQPYEPRDTLSAAAWAAVDESPDAARVVRTIASHDAAISIAGMSARFVIEMLTSVRRFGVQAGELPGMLTALGSTAALEGVALHLPLTEPAGSDAVSEVVQNTAHWLTALDDAGFPANHPAHLIMVSHLDLEQLRRLRLALPGVAIYPRVGTALWLGDASTLRVTGTVLAVHEPSDKGVGYRQRRGPKGARLVVVSGGTSHGVALAAPSANANLRQRAIAASTGIMDAAGKTTSPFTIAGEQRLFAEPPHMHVSLVWLPGNVTAPNVGDEVDLRVRNTTATFDRVVGLD